MKLSIVYEDEDKNEAIASVENELPGTFSVFNLDPGVSKIFIGGIPPGVQVDQAIRSTSFYGHVEDFRLSDRPIGLWNFMSNGTNNVQQHGALERYIGVCEVSYTKIYSSFFCFHGLLEYYVLC